MFKKVINAKGNEARFYINGSRVGANKFYRLLQKKGIDRSKFTTHTCENNKQYYTWGV